MLTAIAVITIGMIAPPVVAQDSTIEPRRTADLAVMNGVIWTGAEGAVPPDIGKEPTALAVVDNRIVAIGDSIKTWLNGVPVADLTDSMTAEGFIALQVHATNKKQPLFVRWRNIRLKNLACN